MENHLRSFDPFDISGKFRRYDQQPNNSAGNALWDLLSTRNTTIQVASFPFKSSSSQEFPQDMFGLLHRVQVYRGMSILKWEQTICQIFHEQTFAGLMYQRASTTTFARSPTSQSSNLSHPHHNLQPILRFQALTNWIFLFISSFYH